MLLHLPQELLINIASNLSCSEKLQLALTCKRLKNTIFERCLYELLSFLADFEKTESNVLAFRREPSKGKKVKLLFINLEYVSKKLLSEIPLIFPNVTTFFTIAYPRKAGYESAYHQFINWKDNLKYFSHDKTDKHYPLLKLLEKNVFSRLTDLNISACKVDRDRIDFFECTKNAPALTHLTVREYTVTIESMEEIHSICPLLFSLTIDSCVILVTLKEHIPKGIAPVLHLSHFKLKATSICDQQGLFLDYLTRKYTKTTQFEFHPDFSEKRHITRVLDRVPYQTTPGPDFTTCNTELHLTHVSYKMSATKTLSHLPNTIKLLKTSSLDLHNPMNIFSRKCVNITSLDLAGNIFESSEDIRMFQNLPFLKRLLLLIDPSVQEPNTASSSTSVIHLEVIVRSTQPQHSMNIGWLLSTFPSLKNLYIRSSEIMVIGNKSNFSKIYPGLTKVSIGPVPTGPSLLSYICDAAPKLKDLYWCIPREHEGRALEDNVSRAITIDPHESHLRRHKIDLIGFTLDCFHLKMHYPTYPYPTKKSFLELINGHGKKKVLITDGYTLVNFTKAAQKKDIVNHITIRFGTTKKIMINSYLSINLKNLKF